MQRMRWGRNLRTQQTKEWMQGVRRVINLRAQQAEKPVQGVWGSRNMRTQQIQESVQRMQWTSSTSQSHSRMLPGKTAEQDHHDKDTGHKGDGGPSDNPDGNVEENRTGTKEECRGIGPKQECRGVRYDSRQRDQPIGTTRGKRTPTQ